MNIPSNSWWHARGELEVVARSMHSRARLRLKQSKIWSINETQQTYATTIGATVYIPAEWTLEQVLWSLPHEVLGHVRQFHWAGLCIHPGAGIPLMVLIYGIFMFPVFLAWGRYRCELHAEATAWAYHLRQGAVSLAYVRLSAVSFAKAVSSSAYAWAVWPRWARWGFKRRAEAVIRRHANG